MARKTGAPNEIFGAPLRLDVDVRRSQSKCLWRILEFAKLLGKADEGMSIHSIAGTFDWG
jgi:hypothetical protein